MDYITMAVGVLPIIYAVYFLVMRQLKKEDEFEKLVSLKEKFGDKKGSMVHYFGYVFLPFSIGIIMIVMGLYGFSLAQIFLFQK